jgi:DNA segregation ATPase FtsK/SpoIIIE, S-DNA-T family
MQSNSKSGGPGLFVTGFAALVLIGAWSAAQHAARAVHTSLLPVAVALAVIAALWLAWHIARFALAGPAGRRNYPLAWLVRARWRRSTRNLGLAYIDQHRADTGRRRTVVYPKARFRPNDHGVLIRVRTTAKATRPEFEKAAPYLAGMTRCARVSVAQERPGRLRVQCLRTDPLTVPWRAQDVPARLRADPWHPYLGVDEWGQHRHVSLPGLAGMLVAGNPGMGKTSGVLWLLDQLAPSPAVQLAIIDGKDGGDFTAWRDRAWLSCGDELPDAVALLEDVHALMRARLRVLRSSAGPRNRWHVGPTADWPLVVTVIDEASTYLDLEAVKGDREREVQVRACRSLAGQLLKKGRAPLFVTILLSQRTTTDSTPSALRDLCGLAMCFGVMTRATAIAALGDPIREYPSYDPSQIREPGVATVTLPCGMDPYVRLRVPEITEAAAVQRARSTAYLRADPSLLLPAEAPVLAVA